MALPLRDGIFLVAAVSGVWLCWLGLYSYRRWRVPGIVPFAAVSVILGCSAIAGTLFAIAWGATVPETVVPRWSDIGLVGWAIAMIPWFVFSLQYTGRRIQFRRRTVLALSAPVVGINLLLAVRVFDVVGISVVTQIFATLSLLYLFALVTVGGYLLMRTTYEYGHLSLVQGLCLTLAGVAPLILLNTISTLAGETADVVVFAVYAAAFVIPAGCLSIAVFRYRMFESTPAIGALGERAIPRELDDLVVVVDRDGRVIKLNEAAVQTLCDSPVGPLGEPLSSVIPHGIQTLRDAESVELETSAGRRKFDPEVTGFTDQYDRPLGSLLSLRDVTDRELRKQRLEVLNRVLRHNIRNQVDVIKSNAEAVAAETERDYPGTIRDAADELADLGATAREIDRLVSREPDESAADLSSVVRELAPSHAEISVTLDLPESAPLVTDWEALRVALEPAIANAVEHADTSIRIGVEGRPAGYTIRITDDGAGIPDAELAALDAETETPLRHGTGLGLWQLKWGVTKLNGDVSFDTTEGTTVRIDVPDRDASSP
ncbi:MAG: ATP-binding protein [Haloplanus sp.]